MFKLFRFLKPYWWQVILLTIATVVQVYTTLMLPALMADIINKGIRTEEDYDMLCKFWPKFIAKFINKFYKNAEKSNNINEK